jgi:methyl-accepting chemotaxis protein WspA
MKNLTLRQHLTFAVAMLIFLIALGAGFALWMEHAQARSERNVEALDLYSARVELVISSYAAAVRGCLLRPGEAAAHTELGEARKALEHELQNVPRLLGPVERLDAFLRADASGKLADRLRSLTPSTRDTALASSLDEIDKIRDQLTQLAADIRTHALRAADLEFDRARFIWWVALSGIIIVFGAALVVARFQSRSLMVPMRTLVASLEQLQRGDFTQRVPLERQDEFGVVGGGLNKLADELSVLVGQVQRSGIQVNSTTTQISATAREQQTTANEIAATTAEIGATSKEISATSKELVKTMNEVSRVSEETAELAGAGQNSISKMETTMRQIMDASGSITAKLAVLNEKTANINSVVTTITKVADQTNLLSLNAAIEAEKAGEYGLGFAVVAMEIRRLADQTAVATYDIEKMVKEMQSAVAAGVMGMDKFSEEVRRGVEDVRQVGAQLAQIIHQVQTLSPRFHTVNEGMHAQATGAQQISETLTQLNEAAQMTAESLRQSNAAIEQLNEAARGLQTAVARFKLKA